MTLKLKQSLFGAVLAAFLAVSAQAQMPAETPSPQARAESLFKQADSNGDGKLSRAEAEKIPGLAARFDELDKDKDGFLSLAEFTAGMSAEKS